MTAGEKVEEYRDELPEVLTPGNIVNAMNLTEKTYNEINNALVNEKMNASQNRDDKNQSEQLDSNTTVSLARELKEDVSGQEVGITYEYKEAVNQIFEMSDPKKAEPLFYTQEEDKSHKIINEQPNITHHNSKRQEKNDDDIGR